MPVSRRGLLKAAGAGITCLAAAPYVRGAERQGDVLAQADDRIARHRKGTAVLSLAGPDGQAFPPGVPLEINQTRHKFLFGCNIFKLGGCRTAADNAAYEKHFAELLNYATLPFYWWTYERQKDRPQDEHTDEIVRWCREVRANAALAGARLLVALDPDLAGQYAPARAAGADECLMVPASAGHVERLLRTLLGQDLEDHEP